MLKHFTFLFFSLILGWSISWAQAHGSGNVKDVSQKPIANVIVTLMQQNSILAFTQTDAKGDFSFQVKEIPQHAELKFSKLGYGIQKIPFLPQTDKYSVILKEESVTLKEVKVKSPPIRKIGDTIRYSVKDFQNVQDRNIGDILKKLPGVEVNPNGTVFYNGKAINEFYIENMNLLKEKYGIAVQNVSPKDVKTVEVLENHQAVKTLQNKEFTDRAAINIQLNDDAKAKWLGSVNLASGFQPFLAQADIVAMSFKAKNQTLNTLKANNTGVDIIQEQKPITIENLFNHVETVQPPVDLLQVPLVIPPLDKKQYLRNHSAALSLNYLTSLRNNDQLRLNASAFYDQQKFDQFQNTQFLTTDTSLVAIHQQIQSVQEMRKGDFSAEWTRNIQSIFLNDRLQGWAQIQQNKADFLGTLTNQQKAYLPAAVLVHQGRVVKTFGKQIFKLNNLQQFEYQPQKLTVNYDFQSDAAIQKANKWRFYSNTNMAFSSSFRRFILENLVGYAFRWDRMVSDLNHFPPHISTSSDASLQSSKWYYEPQLTYKQDQFQVSFQSPVNLLFTNFLTEKKTWWIWNPSANIFYDINPFLRASVSAGLRNSTTDFMQAFPNYFMTDYRSLQLGTSFLALQKSKVMSGMIRYQNPLNYFNAYISANYSSVVNPFLSVLKFNGVFSASEWFWMSNSNANSQIQMSVRKTFMDQNLTLGLKMSQLYFKNNLFQQLQLQKFTVKSIQILPEIKWQWHRKFILSYEATVQQNHQKINGKGFSDALWQQQHHFSLGYVPEGNFNFNISADYFQNEIQKNVFASAFFMNVETRYITKKKWEWSIIARNITGQNHFQSQLFSANQIQMSNYTLRPVNILLAVYYKF